MSSAPITHSDEVCVYRNLNLGLASVTAVKGNDNRGLLIGHTDRITLVGARAVVKQGGRLRACHGPREVYAWWVGKITTADVCMDGAVKVTIHPKDETCLEFFRVDTGAPVRHADAIRFEVSADGTFTATAVGLS